VARILHYLTGRRTGWFKRPQDRKQWNKQGSLHCDMHIMKIITAIVRPFKLDELRHAIAQLGVQGVTVTEVYEAEYGPRAKVEIAVDDSIVEPVLEAIANISRTGRTGDGKILVGTLEQAIRIRTGETGTAAT
jgi:nitrogen regulatory protein P-II 2